MEPSPSCRRATRHRHLYKFGPQRFKHWIGARACTPPKSKSGYCAALSSSASGSQPKRCGRRADARRETRRRRSPSGSVRSRSARPAAIARPAASAPQVLRHARAAPSHRRLQHADGLVIDFQRHGNGCRSLPPCASEKRAGSEKRQGAPCTTSATIARARTVRAPTPGTSSRSAKSEGPRSAAAAVLPCRRRITTSLRRARRDARA